MNPLYSSALRFTLLTALVLMLGASSLLHAQVYSYTNNTAGTYNSVATNTTGTNLARVNGANVSGTPCTSGFTSINFSNSSAWNQNNPAVEFTITPDPGYQLQLTQITAQSARNTTNNGPSQAYYAYSLDGITWVNSANTANIGLTTCTNAIAASTWNFADFNSTTVVYFRIYPNSAVSLTGQHYVRNITLSGAVVLVGIPGCTTATACNYNPAATVNNGTCTFPGCTDATACNYNAAAGCSSGSCLYVGDPCDDGNAATSGDVYIAGCTCTGTIISAASPFIGFAIKEQTINPAALAIIDGVLTDPAVARCWRAYACFGSLNWELQAMAGGDNILPPWTLSSTTGEFYQDPFGGITPANINPVLYPFFPALQYDSWFTIASQDVTSGINLIYLEQPSPFDVLSQWDVGGLNFVAGPSPFGCAITAANSYPSTATMPNAAQEVLVGQFTSDGTVSGTFNFSFRQMVGAGSIFLPITVAYEQSVSFTTPAASNVDICSLLLQPIELISFDAKPNGQQVDLTWVTQTEINNDVFVVERSPNTLDWSELGRLPGAGNSTNTIWYQSYDFKPMMGVNYYRLRQIDTNGQATVSEIKTVEFTPTASLSLYPNPSNGTLVTVKGDAYSMNRVVVRSIDGRIVMDQSFGSDEARFLDLTPYDLAKGVYTVELHSDLMKNPVIERLVIQ